ncbi:Conserved hypothetical protein [Shewanella piezotolerans WP3]|uniref:Lipoprotein n=1 Tax=Shewanella piezotolerans (strain WP3 / JCM 13877) TaxID=225849 RepID=B8CHK4_SHEPW|nr:DUF3261 domain-containing protein [Shewanella piezotolerans]ACJ27130.1 Conserved hypothetical protein [Shewanella piezotolerans WP3]
MPQLGYRLKTFAIVGLLLLTGCSQTLQRQTCVELPSDVNYCLAPIAASSQSQLTPIIERSLTQKATIKTQSSQHELLTQLELAAQQLTLVGLAPLGQPLFTLTYDGHQLISEQSTLLGSQFKAEYLLAIMQLIYWDEDSINQHLQNGYIQGYNCDAGYCRKLYADKQHGAVGDKPIVRISYSQRDLWSANVKLNIDAANFELIINPL